MPLAVDEGSAQVSCVAGQLVYLSRPVSSAHQMFVGHIPTAITAEHVVEAYAQENRGRMMDVTQSLCDLTAEQSGIPNFEAKSSQG